MAPPPPPDPIASLEALLTAAARGDTDSVDLAHTLQPKGVMGALAQMPLTEILQNMDFGKRSVRVDLWVDGAEGTVHVHEGQIVFASATTPAGKTEGEAAVLELCRRHGGLFRIHYAREALDRNVHRPTTFVLLEALRVIDESAPRSTPASVDLGGVDAWGDPGSPPFPPLLPDDDATNPWNDPSAVLDIVVEHDASAPGARPSPPRDLLGLLAESEFLVAAGDLESARRVLSQAQGLAPDDDEVHTKLLNVNESIDAAQANAFLEQAMRGGPQAVALARRATQLRPVRDVLLRSLAVFARGGADDEVADVAEQLLELDPDDEGALRTLLDANIAMKRWSVALHAVESLLRLRPNDEQLQATRQKVVALARRP